MNTRTILINVVSIPVMLHFHLKKSFHTRKEFCDGTVCRPEECCEK